MKRKKMNDVFEETTVIFLSFRGLLQNRMGKILFLISTLLFFNGHFSTSNQMSNNFAYASQYNQSERNIYINSLKSNMKKMLVNEVVRFIDEVSPESKITPAHLVDKCLEYEVDIIFVLSQGILESHLGTKGKAKRTNSVWNVGTYDDGQVLYRYETADESIEPYLKLLNEKYLINITADGDTVYKDLSHLIQDRGYINHNGHRFASARGYENGLRDLMVKINMETSISFYQDFFKLSDDELYSSFSTDHVTQSNELFVLN